MRNLLGLHQGCYLLREKLQFFDVGKVVSLETLGLLGDVLREGTKNIGGVDFHIGDAEPDMGVVARVMAVVMDVSLVLGDFTEDHARGGVGDADVWEGTLDFG